MFFIFYGLLSALALFIDIFAKLLNHGLEITDVKVHSWNFLLQYIP